MGLQSIQGVHKPVLYAPFYGMSTMAAVLDDPVAAAAMLLSLPRFPQQPITINHTFTLDAPIASGLFMYFASPVSLGLVEFVDQDNSFIGGWDGAKNDIYNENAWGPVTMNLLMPNGVLEPFYVYRTDHEDLGPCNWLTRAPT